MLFVAADARARIAFTATPPDKRRVSPAQFLRDAVAYYAGVGILCR